MTTPSYSLFCWRLPFHLLLRQTRIQSTQTMVWIFTRMLKTTISLYAQWIWKNKLKSYSANGDRHLLTTLPPNPNNIEEMPLNLAESYGTSLRWWKVTAQPWLNNITINKSISFDIQTPSSTIIIFLHFTFTIGWTLWCYKTLKKISIVSFNQNNLLNNFVVDSL